jgi:hypothetical protein
MSTHHDEQPPTTLGRASVSALTGPASTEPAFTYPAPIDAAPLPAGPTGCPELALLLDRLTAERYRPVPPPPGRYRERPVADSGALPGAEAVGHEAGSAEPEGGADGG